MIRQGKPQGITWLLHPKVRTGRYGYEDPQPPTQTTGYALPAVHGNLRVYCVFRAIKHGFGCNIMRFQAFLMLISSLYSANLTVVGTKAAL